MKKEWVVKIHLLCSCGAAITAGRHEDSNPEIRCECCKTTYVFVVLQKGGKKE